MRARNPVSIIVLLAVLAGLAALSGGPVRAAHRGYRSFSTRLSLPDVIRARSGKVRLTARPARVPIWPGPRTQIWGFQGSFPGPTIEAWAGRQTRLRVTNALPRSAGSISVHLHGGHHAPKDDGQATHYLISPGRNRTYTYPFTYGAQPERAATLWYHDHRHRVTGRNIWRGLAGMLLLRDRFESRLPLPRGAYEIPLMLTDRSFDKRNRMAYPESAHAAPPSDVATGDHVLVNGVAEPYLDVAARRYRLRIVNASNFTAYNLRLANGRSMVQIGTGQGLLPHPVEMEEILLGPSQRVDLIVSFRGLLGKRVVLESIPRSPADHGTGTPAVKVMQFRVTHHANDSTRVPDKLRPLPRWAKRAPSIPGASWAFGLGADASGGTAWTINGRTFDHDRVDATVPRGSIQTWQITNTSSVTHYVHMHGFPFVLLKRNGADPQAWEAGLDDTFRVDPGDHLLVAAKFPDYLGRYVIHCHMLEHEDHGMMAQFEVVDE